MVVEVLLGELRLSNQISYVELKHMNVVARGIYDMYGWGYVEMYLMWGSNEVHRDCPDRRTYCGCPKEHYEGWPLLQFLSNWKQ